MFRGSSTHTCDPKGRLIVPSRFRDVVRVDNEEKLVITVGPKNFLYGFSLEYWRSTIEKKLSEARTPKEIDLRRLLMGNAQECTCDKQGRILIPKVLRDYASIDKEIMLVGLISFFEIWDVDRWNAQNNNTIGAINAGEYVNEFSGMGL